MAAVQTHGTFVKGKRLPPNKPTLLTDKTPITFGSSKQKFIFSGETTGELQHIVDPTLCAAVYATTSLMARCLLQVPKERQKL